MRNKAVIELQRVSRVHDGPRRVRGIKQPRDSRARACISERARMFRRELTRLLLFITETDARKHLAPILDAVHKREEEHP